MGESKLSSKLFKKLCDMNVLATYERGERDIEMGKALEAREDIAHYDNMLVLCYSS